MTSTEPQSDEDLVELAKSGDDTAFPELVKRYSRRILRVARNITNHEEDSEDVLQFRWPSIASQASAPL